MSAYFIFSLYSIIDNYTRLNILEVLPSVSRNRSFKTLQEMKNASRNPLNGIDWVLKIIDEINPHFKKHIQNEIKGREWVIHKNAFLKLSEVRHNVAHQTPEIPLEKLKENFEKYFIQAEIMFNDFREEAKNFPIPNSFRSSFNRLLEEIMMIMFLEKVGEGIMFYLSLLDLFIAEIFPTTREYHDEKWP